MKEWVFMGLVASSHTVQLPANHYVSRAILLLLMQTTQLYCFTHSTFRTVHQGGLVEVKIIDHFQDFLLSLEDDNITGYSAPKRGIMKINSGTEN